MAFFRTRSKSFLEKAIEGTPIAPWLFAAVASIPLSLALFARGRKLGGLLVGLWTPTLLNASIYNRMLREA